MDAKTLQEKIDLREHNIHEMRAIHEAAVDEKGEARALTAEEKNKFDKHAADVRDLTAQIDAEKRSQTLEGFTAAPPTASEPESRESKEMREFAEYLRTGEKRDYDGLTVDSNGPAGALAPTEFLKELQKDLEKETHLVGKVRILRLNKVQEVEIPIESAEMSDAGWTSEIAAVTKDESLAFTSRKLGADRLAKLVLVSKKAVLTSAFDLPGLVRGELGYKMRCALENAIINGDGSETLALPAWIDELKSVHCFDETTAYEWEKNYLYRAGRKAVWEKGVLYTVCFTGGFDPVPIKIVLVAKQLASLYWESSGGNLAVSSTSYADTGTRVFNNFSEDRFLKDIDAWKIQRL